MENELNILMNLAESLSNIINDSDLNIKEEININGLKINLNKDNGVLNISINQDKTFDDTEIKNIIKEFKDNVAELEDCLFVNAYEEASNFINVKELDELMSKESLTAEESETVLNWINIFKDIIHKHLVIEFDKVKELLLKF